MAILYVNNVLEAKELKACFYNETAEKMHKKAEDFYFKPRKYIAINENAFEMGSVSAGHSIANMYYGGLDDLIKIDKKSAEEWYLKTANMGHFPSMYSLAEMYKDMPNKKNNLLYAYAWCSLADDYLPKYSPASFVKFRVDKYALFLNNLTKKMKKDEVKKAFELKLSIENNFSCSEYLTDLQIFKKENASEQSFDNDRDNVIDAMLNYNSFRSLAIFTLFFGNIIALKIKKKYDARKIK